MKKKLIETIDKVKMEVSVMTINQTVDQNKLIVTQANALARSAQEMTLQEKRLLLLIISQIRRSDKDFVLYRLPIITIQKYLGLSNKNVYSEMEIAVDRLMKRVVTIENEEGHWEKFQWISYCRYCSKGKNNNETYLEVRLHDHLRPLLLNLQKHFGNVYLHQIAPMPSVNSIRIFEILYYSAMYSEAKQKFLKPSLRFQVDSIKERLGLKGKYKNFAFFRRDILERAQRDCEQYTSLVFSWKEEKQGRRIAVLDFTVKRNPMFKKDSFPSPKLVTEPEILPIPQPPIIVPPLTTNLTPEQTQSLTLLKENGVNQNTAKSLAKEFPPSRIIDNIKLTQEKSKQGKVKNFSAIIVSAIRDDWANQTTTPLEQIELEKPRDLKAKKERQAQEAKKIEELKSQFEKELQELAQGIIDSWSKQKRQAEIEAFLEQTNDYVRRQHRFSGMKKGSVRATFRSYVRKKYLTAEERDFERWAKARGYEIDGAEN